MSNRVKLDSSGPFGAPIVKLYIPSGPLASRPANGESQMWIVDSGIPYLSVWSHTTQSWTTREAEGRQIVNLADYLTASDMLGTTEVTTKVQDAIDDTPAGGVLLFPRAILACSELFTRDKAINILALTYASWIRQLNDGRLFNLNKDGSTKVNNGSIVGIGIAADSNKTAGCAVHEGNIQNWLFQDITITHILNGVTGAPYEGWRVGEAIDSRHENIRIQGTRSNPVVYQCDDEESAIIEFYWDRNCQFRSNVAGDGMLILLDRAFVEGVCTIEGGHIDGTFYNNKDSALRFLATVAGASLRNHHVFATLDSSQGTSQTVGSYSGGLVAETTDAGAEIIRLHLDTGAGWSSANNVGAFIGQRVKDWSIRGVIRNNRRHGVVCSTAWDGLVDAYVVDNSQSQSDTYYGIEVGGASKNITLKGKVANSGNSVAKQRGVNHGQFLVGKHDMSDLVLEDIVETTVPRINVSHSLATGKVVLPKDLDTSAVITTTPYVVPYTVSVARIDTTSAGKTVTLPHAVPNKGRIITVKRVAGANAITVGAVSGTVEITSITDNVAVNYLSDGTNWIVI